MRFSQGKNWIRLFTIRRCSWQITERKSHFHDRALYSYTSSDRKFRLVTPCKLISSDIAIIELSFMIKVLMKPENSSTIVVYLWRSLEMTYILIEGRIDGWRLLRLSRLNWDVICWLCYFVNIFLIDKIGVHIN